MPKLKTITLKTTLLNDVPVSNLLTVATKQNVTPTLIFNHIQAKSISCDTLNEVEISNIVQLDQDTSVKGLKFLLWYVFIVKKINFQEKSLWKICLPAHT